MGFGLLFCGYALSFAFSLSPYYFFADILGGLLMMYAYSKLGAFQKNFYRAIVPTGVYVAASAVNAIFLLFGIQAGTVATFIGLLILASMITMHFCMYAGIIKLSVEVGLPELSGKAKRNMCIFVMYFVLYCVFSVFNSSISQMFSSNDVKAGISGFFLLFQLVYILLNLILIGGCCRAIGVEGEDNERNSSDSTYSKLNKKWTDLETRVFTPKEKRNLGNTEKNDINRKKKK